MTGGSKGVGKGLGTGMANAMSAMKIAQQDIPQGKVPMQDPRMMQIYQSLGMPSQAPRA